MKLAKAKELAMQLLRIGKSKIWLNPSADAEINEAMTKEDVRGLITKGAIKKKQDAHQSRGRARILHEKKKKGRKRGQGKRTGTKKARVDEKRTWINKVRAQRKTLKRLRTESPEVFKEMSYRKVYKRVKGNYFRGKKHLEQSLVTEKK
jgi:large subunit ribosomal protein L19e